MPVSGANQPPDLPHLSSDSSVSMGFAKKMKEKKETGKQVYTLLL